MNGTMTASTTTTMKAGDDYLSIHDTAARIGCSVRHLERIISSNDPKRLGVVKVGRRMVRIKWIQFESAMQSGTVRS